MQPDAMPAPRGRAPLWDSRRLLWFGGLIFLLAGVVQLPLGRLILGTLGDRLLLTVLTAALFGVTLFWLGNRFREPTAFFMAAALLLLALFLRLYCLDNQTADYRDFLSPWVGYFRQYGGISAISGIRSDYNVPYLYLLALISYLPTPELYLIKFISIIADMALACTVVSLLGALGQSQNRRMLGLLLALFAPTFWLNSAFWAQCDGVYALLILLSFLYFLRDKPMRGFVMAGLALAFKLQAIFFLPFLAVIWLARRTSVREMVRQTIAFLLAFFAAIFPALALGRSLTSILDVYTTQVGQYSGYLNLNSPSVYAFFHGSGQAMSMAGVVCAAVFILFLLYVLWQKRDRLSNDVLLTVAFLFCLGVPWLLPSMHERYFYLADVFSILYVLRHPRRFYLCPMVIYASYAGYHAYLQGQFLVTGMELPSLLLLVTLIFLGKDLTRQLAESPV